MLRSIQPVMPTPTSGRSTRMELLEYLRRHEGASAETIAGQLGITANAVRQHLTNLERDGLVRSVPVRHKRGRPCLEFSLTERADAMFPKRYDQLASMVLAEVQEMAGPEALDELFRRIALRHGEALAPELEGLDFDAKLERLLRWINRAGTLAEAEQTPDGIRVSIHNCPFRNTALRFPQVCTITPHLMVQLLGAQVSQARSIHRHDPYCSFVLQRPTANAH